MPTNKLNHLPFPICCHPFHLSDYNMSNATVIHQKIHMDLYRKSCAFIFIKVSAYIYVYVQHIRCHEPTIVMLPVELMKNSKVLKQTNLHFRCECATKLAAMIFLLLLFFSLLLLFSIFIYGFILFISLFV